jgi:hypothetical protein
MYKTSREPQLNASSQINYDFEWDMHTAGGMLQIPGGQ